MRIPGRGDRSRGRLAGLAAVVLALTAPHAVGAETPVPALTSPAVDASAYAPGSVSSYSERHDAWTMRCQEIARLHQRFCDLNSTAQGSGLSIGLTVTTSDSGRPAGVLQLPARTLLRMTVAVAAVGEKRATKLRMLRCEPVGCSTVWPLTPAQLAGLSSGKDLSVQFFMIPPNAPAAAPALLEAAVSVTAKLSGKGFADAVKASQDPNPHSH